MTARKKKAKTTKTAPPPPADKPVPSFADGWKAAKVDTLLVHLRYAVQHRCNATMTANVAELILPVIEAEASRRGSWKPNDWFAAWGIGDAAKALVKTYSLTEKEN